MSYAPESTGVVPIEKSFPIHVYETGLIVGYIVGTYELVVSTDNGENWSVAKDMVYTGAISSGAVARSSRFCFKHKTLICV
jgi:hypothetical protein